MKYKDKEFLITQLIENKKSCCQLAKELNVSDFTVRRYAKKFEIDTSIKPKSDTLSNQKTYYFKRKTLGHTKLISNLSDVVFKEFQKIRKDEDLTNEGLLVKFIVMYKESK